MKRNMILNVLVIACVFIAGCGSEQASNPPQTEDSGIAGVWKTYDEKPWQLTLAPDGTVTDVIRSDGLHFVIAEGKLVIEPQEKLHAHYVFGPCTWSYDEISNRLEVSLNVEDMYILTEQTEFKCSFSDTFSGTLSKDSKTWTPEYILTTQFEPPALDQVANNGILTFKKVQ